MKHALMKSLAILAVIGLLASTGVAAQQADRHSREHRSGPPTAEQQLARLGETLNLSNEQAVRLLQVLQTAHGDREALHAQMMQDYGDEICAQRERVQEQIMAELSAEQAAIFQAQIQNRQPNRPDGGGPRIDCSNLGG